MDSSIGLGAGAAVGVVLASEGYPGDPVTGRPLRGADPSGPADAFPLLHFHAGTRADDGGILTSGGRVVTVVGLGPDHAQARAQAYSGIEQVTLEGGQHRSDVALEVASA
jgi:phosphoribosylamine--glycine ligase